MLVGIRPKLFLMFDNKFSLEGNQLSALRAAQLDVIYMSSATYLFPHRQETIVVVKRFGLLLACRRVQRSVEANHRGSHKQGEHSPSSS